MKLAIDCTQLDIAIEKVSLLLELVARLPTGMLEDPLTMPQGKVFINAALLNTNDLNMDDAIAQAIFNSEEFKNLNSVTAAFGIAGTAPAFCCKASPNESGAMRDGFPFSDEEIQQMCMGKSSPAAEAIVKKAMREAIAIESRPGGAIWNALKR